MTDTYRALVERLERTAKYLASNPGIAVQRSKYVREAAAAITQLMETQQELDALRAENEALQERAEEAEHIARMCEIDDLTVELVEARARVARYEAAEVVEGWVPADVAMAGHQVLVRLRPPPEGANARKLLLIDPEEE